jgi:dipeptidyl aminopeptidase/acylaminoacyl peptidase
MGPPQPDAQFEAAVRAIYDVALITGAWPVPGREAAVVLANPGETFQAHLWDWATGELSELTAGKEPVFQAIPAPAGDRMAVLRDEGGNELYRIWVQPLEPGAGEMITPEPLGRVHVIDWFPGSDALLLAGNDNEDTFVARYDLERRTLEKLFITGRWTEGVDLSRDGSRVAFAVSRGEDQQNYDIGVLEVEAPSEVLWVSSAAGSRDTHPRFSPDGRRLAFSAEVEDSPHVVFYDLEARRELARVAIEGEPEALMGWAGDAVHVLVQQRGRQLLLHVERSGRVEAFDHGAGSIAFAQAKGGRLVCAISGLSRAPFARADAIDGRELGTLELPGRAPALRSSSVTVRAPDGTPVHCWVVEGAGEAPRPGVVVVHGGPTWATLDSFRRDTSALAMAGFTVIAPNFRGSTGYGPAFRKANIGDLGGGDLEDCLAAARWLAARPDVDGRRIAIYGGSYGGYMTLWAMVRAPELFACGAAAVPVADWVDDYELADPSFRYFDEFFFGGSPAEKPGLYRDRSPITFVDRLSAPLFITHGRNDSRCPFPPVERFVEKALELGQLVEFDVQEDEGHGAAKKQNRLETDLRLYRFLRRHLFGD